MLSVTNRDLCAQTFYHDTLTKKKQVIMTCFFFVNVSAYRVSHSAEFFSVWTVNKNDANVIGSIFLSNCFEWQSLASLSFGSLRFLRTTISQSSVATCLRCGRIFNYCLSAIYCKVSWSLTSLFSTNMAISETITAKSVGKRILKIC